MQLYMSLWVSLAPEVRNKMREYFGIRRSTSTIVETTAMGGIVRCDGSSDADLKVVSVDKMQHLLNSDSTDFGKLLEQTIEHFKLVVSGDLKQKLEASQKQAEDEAKQDEEKAAEIILDVAKKVSRVGRPRKNPIA